MKIIKKGLLMVLMLSLVLALGACGKDKDKESDSNVDKPEVPEVLSVTTVYDVLGKADGDITAIYGEGQKDSDKDGNIWSRTYKMEFVEGNAEVSFVYDEEMFAQSINVMFNEDSDFEIVKEALSAIFGESEEVNDETIEGNIFLRWEDGNNELILNQGNGPVQVVMSVLEEKVDKEDPEKDDKNENNKPITPTKPITPERPTKPTTPEKPQVNAGAELSNMMANILTDVGELPDLGESVLTSDMFEQYAFVKYQEGMQGLVSEALIGSIAHSVVLVQVPDGVDASAVAEEIKANAKPNKWVCVEAEKVTVSVKGNKILLVMSNTDTTDAITKNFLAL